ncbi:MAG TPA: OsmC family protein [Bacteroidales bacterium]|nr:OsmC family protein [Bacteroidales bacterium]
MTYEVILEGGKKVSMILHNHKVVTDQPAKAGGEDSAPAPFDLFLASIGTCAGYYVKAFCDQRGIPSEGIRILQHVNYNLDQRRVDRIDIEIKLPPEFPDKYKEAVVQAAASCAVKKHLAVPPEIEVFTS